MVPARGDPRSAVKAGSAAGTGSPGGVLFSLTDNAISAGRERGGGGAGGGRERKRREGRGQEDSASSEEILRPGGRAACARQAGTGSPGSSLGGEGEGSGDLRRQGEAAASPCEALPPRCAPSPPRGSRPAQLPGRAAPSTAPGSAPAAARGDPVTSRAARSPRSLRARRPVTSVLGSGARNSPAEPPAARSAPSRRGQGGLRLPGLRLSPVQHQPLRHCQGDGDEPFQKEGEE